MGKVIQGPWRPPSLLRLLSEALRLERLVREQTQEPKKEETSHGSLQDK